ncbi:MAG: hypothetical protein RLP02_37530 [Coleofasciculus sp. C2-GNP5-27]
MATAIPENLVFWHGADWVTGLQFKVKMGARSQPNFSLISSALRVKKSRFLEYFIWLGWDWFLL